MTPLHEVIINKKTSTNPLWIMRQAGRYLPEFRQIRKDNPNFIELCLNNELATEITLQPIKRFNLDAAIIFSDILMLPYGLSQKVDFKKNFGQVLSFAPFVSSGDSSSSPFRISSPGFPPLFCPFHLLRFGIVSTRMVRTMTRKFALMVIVFLMLFRTVLKVWEWLCHFVAVALMGKLQNRAKTNAKNAITCPNLF